MELKILGKYGPYPKLNSATSGYLLTVKDSKILLDAGSGVAGKLFEETNFFNLKAIILSHLHFDHCCDLGVIGYKLENLIKNNILRSKIPLYIPDTENPLKNAFQKMSCFDIKFIKENEIFEIGDIKLQFYKMVHPELSYSVKIRCDDKVFSYSGDSVVCENYHYLIKDANLLLADAAFLDKDYSENKPHASVKQIAQLANKYKINTILTHINPLYSEKDIITEAESITKYCVLAEENKIYKI